MKEYEAVRTRVYRWSSRREGGEMTVTRVKCVQKVVARANFFSLHR